MCRRSTFSSRIRIFLGSPLAIVALWLVPSVGVMAQDGAWEVLAPDMSEGVRSGTWTTEGESVVGTAEGIETAWLELPGEYWDFELELEFRSPAPANGGVVVRGHWLPLMRAPEQNTMYGYQVNLDMTGRGDVGSVIEEHGEGIVMRPAMDAFKTVDPKTWNRVGVTAKGGVIEIRLNGVISGRLFDEKFIGGSIALQVVPQRGGPPATMQYRNVRVRQLDRVGSWRSIFDGTSLRGWKVWGTEEWTISEGVIQGRRGPKNSEGYLATEETWSDFRVRGEFRMLGDGNYGLFYHSRIRLREEDGYPLISGVQGEVMPGRPAETGRLYESYRRGWLMEKDHGDVGSWALREGAWNGIEIRSRGNQVSTWVNGIRVVDFRDVTPQLFEGSFALQLHAGDGAGIDWRALYVADDAVR